MIQLYTTISYTTSYVHVTCGHDLSGKGVGGGEGSPRWEGGAREDEMST